MMAGLLNPQLDSQLEPSLDKPLLPRQHWRHQMRT